MTMAFPESADDRIQRALNDAKRAELADRFGGVFIAGDMPLPAEIECEFLQRIEEFELKWAAHEITTVRAFIGDPPVKLPSELAAGELDGELASLIGVLEANDIELDFAERPDDAEVYRFIVEDLLDHEIDDIRVPGMVCHFVYEEFHPNPALDARMTSKFFLDSLMQSAELLTESLARDDLRDGDGRAIELAELRQTVDEFRMSVATVLDHAIDITACTVDGNDAHVVATLSWSGLEAGSMNELNARGEAHVEMRRGLHGEWEPVRLTLPGM